MFFDELNEDNFLLFAIKNYNNPQGLTEEDFYKDLNHFRYIKRHLKKYLTTGDLKINLLLKHLIILYNIFGDAATPMLFFKMPRDLWGSIKTFIVFLNRLPEYPLCYIHQIEIDEYCMVKLKEITNEKN
jgi:hypothetical protein